MDAQLPKTKIKQECHISNKINLKPSVGLRFIFPSCLQFSEHLDKICNRLATTRPTAVNLFWALDRMKKALRDHMDKGLPEDWHQGLEETSYKTAELIRREDIDMCKAIGKYGAEFLRDGESWLTHCNAGALATGGYGTALGVFRAAKEAGKKFHVYVDETRPLLQGSRLTAWELQEEGIDATLICDNMAASMMSEGKVQAIVVGADRITTDGFVANKIGTYGLAVLAAYHQIPFYVAAPISTFDPNIAHGREIVIEERSPQEVRHFGKRLTAPEQMPVANPAFDVTPPDLITAIFTNKGVLRAPFRQGIQQLLKTTGKS